MMILMMTMMDLTKRRRDVRRKRSVVRRKRAIVERMTLTTMIIERTNTQEVATMAEEMSMAKLMVKAITRIDERNMVVAANNSMEVSSSMEVSNTRTNHPMVGVKNNMGMVDNKNTTSTEVSVVKSMVTEEDDAIVPNLVTETSIETSIAPVGIERLLFRL